MFNKLSEVLQSATDVLAPPPTPFQDFEYHWRKVKQFYNKDTNEQKHHIQDTNIPLHLNGMLDLLVAGDCNPECVEFLINNRPLDLMTDLCLADSPPGMRSAILTWMRRFLANADNSQLDHPSIYQPTMKLLFHINHSEPGVTAYEKEEVLFLIALIAAVLKCPEDYLSLFVDTHQEYINQCFARKVTPQKNSLFDPNVCNETIVENSAVILQTVAAIEPRPIIILPTLMAPCSDPISSSSSNLNTTTTTSSCQCDSSGKFLLLAPLLKFFNSPSHEIVIKACEGVLMLVALKEDHVRGCNTIFHSLEDCVDLLVEKLAYAYSRIPDDIDPLDIDLETITWGLNIYDGEERYFVGKLPLLQFLCWVDYYDCVTRECQLDRIGKYATFKFLTELLQAQLQPAITDEDDVRNPSKMMLLTKMLKQMTGEGVLYRQCVDWLLMENGQVFNTLLDYATDNPYIALETLSLVELFLDKPNLKVLNCLVLNYLERRSYFNHDTIQSWSDEEDERERRRGSHGETTVKSKTLAPNNILKVINNFLLLLPKQILGDCVGTGYEEYVQDASRHYRTWVERTKGFNWPVEAVSPRRVAPPKQKRTEEEEKDDHPGLQDSNDSGIAEEVFYEGPLLRMLFHYIRNMVHQPYELNLAIIAIISKLAFLPHPFLHELLLNPEVPILPGVNTLWTAIQETTRQILARVPLIENFKAKIEATGRKLLIQEEGASSRDRIGECEEEDAEPDSLLESVIVLEEFAKELAAIAIVKYHFATEA